MLKRWTMEKKEMNRYKNKNKKTLTEEYREGILC